jgi:hypothetical protein
MSPVVWQWATIVPAACWNPPARKRPTIVKRRSGGDAAPTWPSMNRIIGRPTLSIW